MTATCIGSYLRYSVLDIEGSGCEPPSPSLGLSGPSHRYTLCVDRPRNRIACITFITDFLRSLSYHINCTVTRVFCN